MNLRLTVTAFALTVAISATPIQGIPNPLEDAPIEFSTLVSGGPVIADSLSTVSDALGGTMACTGEADVLIDVMTALDFITLPAGDECILDSLEDPEACEDGTLCEFLCPSNPMDEGCAADTLIAFSTLADDFLPCPALETLICVADMTPCWGAPCPDPCLMPVGSLVCYTLADPCNLDPMADGCIGATIADHVDDAMLEAEIVALLLVAIVDDALICDEIGTILGCTLDATPCVGEPCPDPCTSASAACALVTACLADDCPVEIPVYVLCLSDLCPGTDDLPAAPVGGMPCAAAALSLLPDVLIDLTTLVAGESGPCPLSPVVDIAEDPCSTEATTTACAVLEPCLALPLDDPCVLDAILDWAAEILPCIPPDPTPCPPEICEVAPGYCTLVCPEDPMAEGCLLDIMADAMVPCEGEWCELFSGPPAPGIDCADIPWPEDFATATVAFASAFSSGDCWLDPYMDGCDGPALAPYCSIELTPECTLTLCDFEPCIDCIPFEPYVDWFGAESDEEVDEAEESADETSGGGSLYTEAAGRWSVQLLPPDLSVLPMTTTDAVGAMMGLGTVRLDFDATGDFTQHRAMTNASFWLNPAYPPSEGPSATSKALAWVGCGLAAVAVAGAIAGAAVTAPVGAPAAILTIVAFDGLLGAAAATCVGAAEMSANNGHISCGYYPASVAFGGQSLASSILSLGPIYVDGVSDSGEVLPVYYGADGSELADGSEILVHNGTGYHEGLQACNQAVAASNAAAEAAAQGFHSVQGGGVGSIIATVDLVPAISGPIYALSTGFYSPTDGLLFGCEGEAGCPTQIKLVVSDCGTVTLTAESNMPVNYIFAGTGMCATMTVYAAGFEGGVGIPVVLSAEFEGHGADPE